MQRRCRVEPPGYARRSPFSWKFNVIARPPGPMHYAREYISWGRPRKIGLLVAGDGREFLMRFRVEIYIYIYACVCVCIEEEYARRITVYKIEWLFIKILRRKYLKKRVKIRRCWHIECHYEIVPSNPFFHRLRTIMKLMRIFTRILTRTLETVAEAAGARCAINLWIYDY